MTSSIKQTWFVTRMAIATIPQRWGASLIVVVSIACVVGVLVALLAMGAGFAATLQQTGSDDTALVLQAGAQSEAASAVTRDVIDVVSQAPMVLRRPEGAPILSAELLVSAALPKKGGGPPANVAIRGVGPAVWDVRPQIKLVSGRRFHSGLNELLVGQGVHDQFAEAQLGSTLTLNGQSWTIVGVFDSRDGHNSEIWGDADVIASAFRRGGGRTSIAARLIDAHAFSAFKDHLLSDPRLKVDVQTTRQYYSRQSETLARVARILGVTVGVIMAIGAVIGALNTMFTAVASRTREIATLRAMGFPAAPVIVSVLFETLSLAAIGGALGALTTWAIFDGFTASTMGAGGQVMFAFRVSPALLWTGLQWALAIGLIGGVFPAVRAARLSVAAGLRAS